MSNVTLFVHMYADDVIDAEIASGGSLNIDFGSDLTVFIDPEEQPEHFARFCKVFGLQATTAPGLESEDGEPAGNEPERAGAETPITQ